MARKSPRRGGRTRVVSRHGSHRFQTGMITAMLMERGMPMEQAFDLSKQLRQRIADRDEVTTAELRAELAGLLTERGLEAFQADRVAAGREQPFVGSGGADAMSGHILLRDLLAIGLPVRRAQDVGIAALAEDTSDPLALSRAVEELLAEIDSAYPRRYRLVQWMRHTTKPVVLFLAGATGTGKSTLAMELAFRLGIRLVVSTDMIREALRSALSAAVVPGLHDHSFRGMLQGGQVLSDPRERVLAGFRQQSAQVAAGVRAVVRRAVRENTHVLVEGTHLIPPFSAYLPRESLYHAGLMLAVTSADAHRDRFPKRARTQRLRDPSAYLEAFQSVRWIHDDLLAVAEDHDVVVLATTDEEPTAAAALDTLSRSLPVDDPARAPVVVARAVREGPPTLLLVLDGLADEPHDVLGGLTPLAAAHTPTLRRLAAAGGQGQIDTTGPDGTAHTDVGMWSLLGARPPDPPLGRGLCEAIGGGLPLPNAGVVFRGNLATADRDGLLLDRRAGRIRAGVRDLLAGLESIKLGGGVRANIWPGHEHRVVVVLAGEGLSPRVSNSDPGDGAAVQQILMPHPLDDSPEAARTASFLRRALRRVQEHLEEHPVNQTRIQRGLPPANCVITRGAAPVAWPRIEGAHPNAVIVAACPTALGVGRMLGMQPVRGPGMTGNIDTDLDRKFDIAAEQLATHELVVVHVKGTDILAHERRPVAKRDFISRVDAALGRMLASRPELCKELRIVVSTDHGTSSRTGMHLNEPVPVLVAGAAHVEGEGEPFDEESAAHGALGLLKPGELHEMLW